MKEKSILVGIRALIVTYVLILFIENQKEPCEQGAQTEAYTPDTREQEIQTDLKLPWCES